jgi:TetR/AcrR family transcriptional regulator, regulator of mycofactocin system
VSSHAGSREPTGPGRAGRGIRREAPAGPGRPPSTTADEIQRAAITLFAHSGYAQTSIDDIAAALDIGRTTFFRYFRSKSSVIWHDYEDNRRRLAETLAAADQGRPVMAVVRDAVLATVRYAESDRAVMQTRGTLIAETPELFAEGAAASARWARVISDWVRGRLGPGADPTLPDAIGYAVLGAVSAATEAWSHGNVLTLAALLGSGLDAITPHLQAAIDANLERADGS